jgi:hypothetical protein
MPTDIEYSEALTPPYQSYRNVEVYGDDKQRRLAELPREVDIFEQALTSVANQIREGNFVRR